MTKKLEAIYLTNVLLYIDSFESVYKFIQINKKCTEASEMIRMFTKRRVNDCDKKENRVFPNNVLEIFPTTQTVECTLEDVILHPDVMNEITFINLELVNEENHFGSYSSSVIFGNN